MLATPVMAEPQERLSTAVAVAGIISGIRTVLGTATLAALVTPAHSGGAGAVLNALLVGALIGALVIATFSGLRTAIAQPQDGPAVIIAAFVAAIVAAGEVADGRIVLLLLGTIAISSMFTGAIFFAVGHFHCGRFVRFIPYPVIGGFLAGSGLLITLMALAMLFGSQSDSGMAFWFAEPARIGSATAGIVFGVVLLFVTRRFKGALVLPGMMLGAAILCLAGLWLTGTPAAEARVAGWLPALQAGVSNAPPMAWTAMPADLLLNNLPTFGAVALVSIVAMLLNLSGLEVAANADLDFDRELRVAGVANMVGGACGGMVGFHALSATLLGRKMGGDSRMIGLVSAAVIAAVLLVGVPVLSNFPSPVLGGLMLAVGVSLLGDWVVSGWSRFARTEFFVIVAIVLVMSFAGYLAGVGIGVLLSTILFVWSYSRVKVISQELSGVDVRSNMERNTTEMALLASRGSAIRLLKLEGFLFFGTAYSLLARVQDILHAPANPLRFLVIDFAGVKAVDSSAVSALARIQSLCHRTHCELAFTRVGPETSEKIAAAAQAVGTIPPVFHEDFDTALEQCEESLLQELPPSAKDRVESPFAGIEKHLVGGAQVERFKSYLESRSFAAGDYLMRQGDAFDCMHFILAGRVRIVLRLDDGREIRIRSMKAGATIGEIGLYHEGTRTASALAEIATRTLSLSTPGLQAMEKNDPMLAQALHRAVVELLSERLTLTNSLLRKLNA